LLTHSLVRAHARQPACPPAWPGSAGRLLLPADWGRSLLAAAMAAVAMATAATTTRADAIIRLVMMTLPKHSLTCLQSSVESRTRERGRTSETAGQEKNHKTSKGQQ
jgi:hypothetical protein